MKVAHCLIKYSQVRCGMVWCGGAISCPVSGPPLPIGCSSLQDRPSPIISHAGFPSPEVLLADPHILSVTPARRIATPHSDQFSCSFHSFVRSRHALLRVSFYAIALFSFFSNFRFSPPFCILDTLAHRGCPINKLSHKRIRE